MAAICRRLASQLFSIITQAGEHLFQIHTIGGIHEVRISTPSPYSPVTLTLQHMHGLYIKS